MQSSNKLNFEIATSNLPIVYIYAHIMGKYFSKTYNYT